MARCHLNHQHAWLCGSSVQLIAIVQAMGLARPEASRVRLAVSGICALGSSSTKPSQALAGSLLSCLHRIIPAAGHSI